MIMGIKRNVVRTAVLCFVVLLAMTVIGVTYAGKTGTLTVKSGELGDPFSWVVSNDNGVEENYGGYNPIDPGDNVPTPLRVRPRT